MNTVNYRYEVGYEGLEACDNVSTIREACGLAVHVAKQDPKETVYVYDRMAHLGKPELWHLVDGKLKAVRVRELAVL